MGCDSSEESLGRAAAPRGPGPSPSHTSTLCTSINQSKFIYRELFKRLKECGTNPYSLNKNHCFIVWKDFNLAIRLIRSVF